MNSRLRGCLAICLILMRPAVDLRGIIQCHKIFHSLKHGTFLRSYGSDFELTRMKRSCSRKHNERNQYPKKH